MAATGSDPARSGATAVGHSGAGTPPPALPRPPAGTAPPPTAPPLAPPPAPAASGGGDKDWAAEAADAVERVVGTIRSKTVGPLEKLARILVYGLVALIVGVAAAVLVAAGSVRALDLLVPGDVWAAHGITGGIFTGLGLFLWKKRTVKTVKV